MTFETYYLRLVNIKNNESLANLMQAELFITAVNNRWDVTPRETYTFEIYRYKGPRKAEVRIYRDGTCLDWVTSLPVHEKLFGGRTLYFQPLDKENTS